MPTSIPEVLSTTPALTAALIVALRLVLAYQGSLSWPEYRAAHAAKRALFPTLHRAAARRGLRLVNAKGYRDDDEYLGCVDASLRTLVRQLRAGGGSLHLLNSIKRRPTPAGRQYSVAHVVWTHDDDTQTEAYLFPAADSGIDVYAHHEHSVALPVKHLSEGQRDGDPRGVVAAALERGELRHSIPTSRA